MNLSYFDISKTQATKLKEMDASQYIGRAWRMVHGKRQLVDISYQDPTWPNGFDHHYESLIKTIDEGGIAIGAFLDDNQLVGFLTVNKNVLIKKASYVLLDQLFISKPYRNKGIGKKLFTLAKQKASAWGVDYFLICAGSAEETVAFYLKLGCSIAEGLEALIDDLDPRDLIMTYPLQKHG